jgi:ketosteroid isomerase-like protein
MRYWQGHGHVYWFTLLLVFGLLAGCSELASDETRLRQAIADMEKAAEAKQIRPILAYLADDFLGNKVYRKANIGGMLLLHFRQNQHIHVYLHIVELKIKADQAQIQCQVVLAGRDEKIVPERARILVIDSDWQKRDGEWQVVKAHWKDPFIQP